MDATEGAQAPSTDERGSSIRPLDANAFTGSRGDPASDMFSPGLDSSVRQASHHAPMLLVESPAIDLCRIKSSLELGYLSSSEGW